MTRGQTIKLTLTSSDTSYILVFEGLDVSVNAGSAETTTRRFTAKTAGA